MAFPVPMFAAADWLDVWLWPTIMAVTFSLFLRGRHEEGAEPPRPLHHRLVVNFIIFASVWIPFQIVGDAIERGGHTQGVAWPVAWGFGVGLVAMLVTFGTLLMIAIKVEAVGNWLGFNRKRAGKA